MLLPVKIQYTEIIQRLLTKMTIMFAIQLMYPMDFVTHIRIRQ